MILRLLTDPGWAEAVPTSPGPPAHLRLGLSQPGPEAIDLHITGGRPQPAPCLLEDCEAELHVELDVDPKRLAALLDLSNRDPIRDLLAPPSSYRGTFDALMYLGGVLLTWVDPLRTHAAGAP